MATRRLIKGVLGNFLGTYVSQMARYRGQLLFGHLIEELSELRINLLGQPTGDPDSPIGTAIQIAVTRFEEQRRRAQLRHEWLREAWLTLHRPPDLVYGTINGHTCAGFLMRFVATAVLDTGSRYERERVEFIAPHETVAALRSPRAAPKLDDHPFA
jgi:hypothetical protein